MVRHTAVALPLTLLLLTPAVAAPIGILFVGNSFTHGKYDPVRTYNAGFGTGTGNVHDVNCLTARRHLQQRGDHAAIARHVRIGTVRRHSWHLPPAHEGGWPQLQCVH